MMKKIKHPNIIQLYDSFIDRQFDSSRLKRNQEKISVDVGNTAEDKSRYSADPTGGTPDRPLAKQSTTKKSKSDRSLYIAMEFAEAGDMQSLINK